MIRNLVDPERGYPGPIYPVNPKADEILGLRCYPDIAAVPDPVELAVLIIPAGDGAGRDRGVRPARHQGGGGHLRRLPRGRAGGRGASSPRWSRSRERYGMRIMGPNGIGVIDTHTPLNTTFVKGMPPHGNIAFLSQSGALCGGIIDWTIGRGIGFSRFLSVGNEADVNETDVIPFLAADDASRVHHPLSGGRQGRAGVRGRAARRGRPQAGAGASRPAAPPAARRPPPRTPARWRAPTRRSAPPAGRPA